MPSIAFRALFKKRKRRKTDPRLPVWSILDPEPLHDIVRRGFLRENLEKALQEKSTLGIAIAASELVTGRTVWFLEGENATPWNIAHSIGLNTKMMPEHLAASCSVPVFLPPVMIDNRYYVDGSLRLTHPFSAAIHLGASRILCIRSEHPQPTDLPVYGPKFKPRISHVIRMLVNQLSIDGTSEEAGQIEVLNRFHQLMSRKARKNGKQLPFFHEAATPADYKPIEICLFYPSKQIRQSSVFSTYESGPAAHSRRTRFMFHEKFIGELIDMGYADAKNKHEELRQFFVPEKKPQWWTIFAKA